MTRRAFVLIAVAYACLAVGAIVSLWQFDRQQDDLEAVNRRLVQAALAYCEAGLQPDALENEVLEQMADGTYDPEQLDAICLKIADRLRP